MIENILSCQKYDTNVLVREDDFVILAASNNIEELEKQGVKEVKS